MTTRRGFLQRLVGVFAGLTGLSFLGPVVAYLAPKKEKGGRKILLDPNGSPVKADILNKEPSVVGFGINGEPTIVIKYEGELRAFSAVCTHLGCLVKWKPAKAEFFCPCHAGRFDANGVNIAGPPPEPLPRYRVYVTGDNLLGLEEGKA